MSNLPYVNIEDVLDVTLIESWWKEFTETFSHTGYHRNNGGKSDINITELYGHELFIKDDPDAVRFKETVVNAYTQKLLKKLNLENIDFHVTFMVTNRGVLDWHTDDASSTRPGCSGALMYSLNKDKRAPTEWMYNDTYYKLDGYKFALINCSCSHRVDNREHDSRRTFRIALYGIPFEEIRNRVIESGYAL
jgi:hypothetical protein